MTRPLATGIALIVLLCWNSQSAWAGTVAERQVSWERLSVVVGQKVRVVMPDGTLIQGRATELKTDGLAVIIQRTSNQAAYPKGQFLLPRATLHAVDVIQHSAFVGRAAGVAVGAGLGYLAARGAINASKSNSGAASVLGVLAAGLPLTGYFLGRAADRRVTTYMIGP